MEKAKNPPEKAEKPKVRSKRDPAKMRRWVAGFLVAMAGFILLACGVILVGLFWVAGTSERVVAGQIDTGSQVADDGQFGDAKPVTLEAVAESVKALNPQAEVLEVDAKAGTVKVKDAKTGEITTLNLADLPDLAPGPGAASETSRPSPLPPADEPPPPATAPSESPPAPADSKPAVPVVPETPGKDGVPRWVPRPANVSIRQTIRSQREGKESGFFSYDSDHSVKDLMEFYKQTLRAQQIPIRDSISTDRGEPVLGLINSAGSKKVQIQVAKGPRSSTVTVAYAAE